jgi:hypothetical protein
MKKRNATRTHPRKPKLVREWSDEASGWEYCLWQMPSGTYVVSGSDGDDWCEESGQTIKAALAAARATPAQVEELLTVEE